MTDSKGAPVVVPKSTDCHGCKSDVQLRGKTRVALIAERVAMMYESKRLGESAHMSDLN